MGIVFNGGTSNIAGNVTVNISGGWPVNGSNPTVVTATATPGAATTTLYTVPASKKFYLMGAAWSSVAAVIASALFYQGDGTLCLNLQVGGVLDSKEISSAFPIGSATAGQTITCTTNKASNTINIWGILVDA